MVLNAILRLLNSRCPACFKPVGPGAVRLGLRLYCSPEHRDKHAKRGDATRGTMGRMEGGNTRG